jgi:hypothetical protein
MTKGQLKAALAVADAKGQPDSAEVTFDGAVISDSYQIQLGSFAEGVDAGAVESATVPPSFGLIHKS